MINSLLENNKTMTAKAQEIIDILHRVFQKLKQKPENSEP